MLVPVQLTESAQLPQADAAVSQGHQNGLLAGMKDNALKGCCSLSKHVEQLEIPILS